MSDCVICGEGPLLLDEFYRCRVCRKAELEKRSKKRANIGTEMETAS